MIEGTILIVEKNDFAHGRLDSSYNIKKSFSELNGFDLILLKRKKTYKVLKNRYGKTGIIKGYLGTK